MAEIRSTLDMVLEKAARMAEQSRTVDDGEEQVRRGMRLAADYLQSEEDSSQLQEILAQQDKAEQMAVLRGMTDTLLRNIVLPRDELLLHSSLKALQGVAELAPGDVASICQELQQILNQYSQHKEQMQQQLDEAIRSQLKQKLAQQGTHISDEMSINPAMHPQYNEEMERMIGELNGQYNEALDQRKEAIRQRLVPVR